MTRAIKEALRLKSVLQKNKTLLPVSIKAYKLLRSGYFRAFMGIVFTLVFAVQLEISDFKTYKIYDAGFYSDKWHLLVTAIAMFLFHSATILVDAYQKRDQEMIACLKESNKKQAKIDQWVGRKLLDMTENMCKPVSSIPAKDDFQTLNYQDIATFVCHYIYDAIKNTTGAETHQVSIMHKFVEHNQQKREYIKMIAYGNSNQLSPGVFNNKYYLDEARRYYHARIFAENTSQISILKSRQEVGVNLLKIKGDSNHIKQYIGIPIFCERKGIVSLLQISSDTEGLFGRTEEEIKEFMVPFLGYVHILAVYHQLCELLILLSKKFVILDKRIKEMKLRVRRRKNGDYFGTKGVNDGGTKAAE